MFRFFAALLLALPLHAAPAFKKISAAEAMPDPRDFTHMFWANGWDNAKRDLASPKVLSFETGWFALGLNIEKLQVLHFGPNHPRHGYDDAPLHSPQIFAFPGADLKIQFTARGKIYRAIRAAKNTKDWLNYPARIIDSGRFVQRADILQVEFETAAGEKFPSEGRLEITAWPDHLTLHLDLTNAPLVEVSLGSHSSKTNTLEIVFSAESSENKTIDIPNQPAAKPNDHDHLERHPISFTNNTDAPKTLRLFFNKDKSVPNITGLTPILRDQDGQPTGVPIQISKNWHTTKDRPVLYQGGWLHCYTMLHLPPRSIVVADFTIAFARWGGVPAVSHAQLSLIGWGGNQLWDEVAIGSWGESICYEPDRVQRRCMIDDIRPLMVTPMSGKPGQYDWTANVGGGDFLVYYNDQNVHQRQMQTRATYHAVGPNLTSVTYSGQTADHHIAVRMNVSSPRTDDINRVYHSFRYDILKPTPFKRLAFYQLGADHYNNPAEKIAIGNETGLLHEWPGARGERRYYKANLPSPGRLPWFSLHNPIKVDNHPGPSANRGLIIRNWKARLAGKEAPPHFSIYGTEQGRAASANIELSPPADITQLHAGDYIESTLELVVLPAAAADYFGPNEKLRTSLLTNTAPWQSVHRQAVGNDIQIEVVKGKLIQSYPPLIRAARNTTEFKIIGGLGYLPITIEGLTRHEDFRLVEIKSDSSIPIDQTVHQNDFWQTTLAPGRRFSRTYNISFDNTPTTRTFRLEPLR